jgi:glycosyltransferase involved in cell wall biosynthesis
MDPVTEKPTILIICDYYLPGFESGGAMRTLVNMVDRVGDEFSFRVITRDHDGPLNRVSYASVGLNAWNRVGNADVYYLTKENVRPGQIRDLINQTAPDAIYLNSFFSKLTVLTLSLRRFNKIRPIPIILAPEGELVPGGLKLKPLKKRLYITIAKLLSLLNQVIWKAASDSEQIDVETEFGPESKIYIAPNMPPQFDPVNTARAVKPPKIAGEATMVFLSRFMRKKNFNWLLEHIVSVKGRLSIDIFGPLEDAEYWEETQRILKTLPGNIDVQYKGTVPHEKVAETLAKYHFFVLPTLGENFGHIFVEALAAGCPIIASDRSPWRDLEKQGIGWDIPLEDPNAWTRAINRCLNMDDREYQDLSDRGRKFAIEWLSDPAHEKANRNVLRLAVRPDS